MPGQLPDICYAGNPEDAHLPMAERRVILIKKGEANYYPSKESGGGQDRANVLNTRLGVTRAQCEAMLMGSMFGFHTPAANPDNYDEDGSPKVK